VGTADDIGAMWLMTFRVEEAKSTMVLGTLTL